MHPNRNGYSSLIKSVNRIRNSEIYLIREVEKPTKWIRPIFLFHPEKWYFSLEKFALGTSSTNPQMHSTPFSHLYGQTDRTNLLFGFTKFWVARSPVAPRT